MRRTLIAAACLAALAGCATPSRHLALEARVPELAPSTSARVEQGLAIDRWWKHLGDAQLEAFIDEALARNADLEQALGRVREARATLDVVRGAQSPTLDARFNNSRAQQSTVSAMPLPPSVARENSSHKLSLEAGFEVDLWGRLSSSTAAARSQLLATDWARAAVEWGLTAAVAQTYYELAAFDRQIEVSRAMRESRAATLNLRRREHAVGAGSEFDLRRAEAELTGTDASLASLARQRSTLEHSLLLLLGRAPSDSLVLRRSPLDESKAFTAVLPQGAGAELLVRRPDVRQMEAQLAAANYNVDAARAALLPSLKLTGSIGSDAKSLSDLFTGPAAIWSLGANLAQPILDGGRLRAQTRQEQARAEQALAGYRKTIAGAVLDVREAYEGLDLTQQALDAQRARVAALDRARTLAQRGHAAGAASYLDLLDAERNLYQAQLDQVSAYRDQRIGQIAAFKALGGGYTSNGSSL